MRKRRILFAGFGASIKDTRWPKSVMFGELLVGGAAVHVERQEKVLKRVDGVSPERPQSFRHHRRPVNDCSP